MARRRAMNRVSEAGFFDIGLRNCISSTVFGWKSERTGAIVT
jgi:hypothetical protein